MDTTGLVNVIHSHPSATGAWNDGGDDNDLEETKQDSRNLFRVGWANHSFPTTSSNCSYPACTTHGQTCICDTDVTTVAVFTDALNIPSKEEVLSALKIGSAAPDVFDDGLYAQCTSSACTAQPAVEVWMRGSQFDETTIFSVATDHQQVLHLANKASTVSIRGSSAFKFRNPPGFMEMHEPTMRDAMYETEALIDHLFHHPNVAPFISKRLIQRFTSSNPSPRYVQAVSTAFRTGSVRGRSYGGYGSLGATIAAIILDPEARSPTLQLDTTHGQLREPLLKVIHVMRSLEFASRDGREIELVNLEYRLKQQAYFSPSVFSFFLPEFTPSGPIGDLLLHSPEAEIATTPTVRPHAPRPILPPGRFRSSQPLTACRCPCQQIMNFLNGMTGLINWGLTSCAFGFGSQSMNRRADGDRGVCHNCNGAIQDTNDGDLAFVPSSTDPAEIIAELDLLLTSGRLSPRSTAIVRGAYDDMLAAPDPICVRETAASNALRVAQTLLVISPEFHSTNEPAIKTTTRVIPAPIQSQNRTYKATVVVFLNGGCDSFNLLVPHSGCGSKDMYAEYAAVRGEAQLSKSSLLQIPVPISNFRGSVTPAVQPCTTFGVHPSLPLFRDLYNDGDLAFLANIGSLVEPIHKADFFAKQKEVPPSLFAHNTQQIQGQSVHAQLLNAKGILGRIRDTLSEEHPSRLPFAANSYSVTGAMKIVEGVGMPNILNKNNGMVQLGIGNGVRMQKIPSAIRNMTSVGASLTPLAQCRSPSMTLHRLALAQRLARSLVRHFLRWLSPR